MDFDNVYDDDRWADAYAKLEFPGTYYLAYRDLSDIIREHVKGAAALDFGCGAGRSTRFLKRLDFKVVGVDIAENMIAKARELDPTGDYRRVTDGALCETVNEKFNLVLSAFAFDNIATAEKKVTILRDLKHCLSPSGCIINLVSSPKIYLNEWASFTTKDFPENQQAGSGDRVKIVITDIDDPKPVVDILWTDIGYRKVYSEAGLTVVDVKRPLATGNESFDWGSELEIPPWVIYILK